MSYVPQLYIVHITFTSALMLVTQYSNLTLRKVDGEMSIPLITLDIQFTRDHIITLKQVTNGKYM